MSNTPLKEIFFETFNSYYCAHGHAPKQMRANFTMRQDMFHELEKSGFIFVPNHGSNFVNGWVFARFEFSGVDVVCDIPTTIPTFLAA